MQECYPLNSDAGVDATRRTGMQKLGFNAVRSRRWVSLCRTIFLAPYVLRELARDRILERLLDFY